MSRVVLLFPHLISLCHSSWTFPSTTSLRRPSVIWGFCHTSVSCSSQAMGSPPCHPIWLSQSGKFYIPESVPCVSLLSLCLGTCVQRNSPKQLKRSVRTGCECSKQVECHLLKLPEKGLVGTEPQRFGRPQLGVPHSSVLLGETPVSGESLSLPLIGHW